MEVTAFEQRFILSPQKALFWVDENLLIIADAHFSKETHFRKNGIAVPYGILQVDLQRIDLLIATFNPSAILFLGDMFHSDANEGLNEFLLWRQKHKTLKLQLVIGNHDVLQTNWYTQTGIEIIKDSITINNIILSHDKLQAIPPGKVNFFGHVHPSIRMIGLAKQTLRCPCFCFAANYVVFPAFGKFTGSIQIKVNKNDAVYAIAESAIYQVQ